MKFLRARALPDSLCVPHEAEQKPENTVALINAAALKTGMISKRNRYAKPLAE